MDSKPALTVSVREAYDEFYSQDQTEWRTLGAKYKSKNILEVCSGLKFDKVLECGAGDGSILEFISRSDHFSELYAVEISQNAIELIRNKKIPKLKEVKHFDGYTIPYPDKFFDLVYCSHVIEHVEHPRLLLRELKRISKKLVFEIPLDYSVGVDRHSKHYLAYGHINIYSPSLFRFLLLSEGFSIEKELLSVMPSEILEFQEFVQLKKAKTLINLFKVKSAPLRRWLRRLTRSKKTNEELGYSAFTCICSSDQELSIF